MDSSVKFYKQRIKMAIEKYGEEKVKQCFRYILNWLNGETDKYTGQKILEHVEIYNFIYPMPKVPLVLYRGLRFVKKVPKPNQKVDYIGSYKGNFSGWSENTKTALDFCGIKKEKELIFPKKCLQSQQSSEQCKGKDDIFLKVSGKEFKQHTIIYWPISKECAKALATKGIVNEYATWYFKEKEWIVYIDPKKPMQIKNWYYCGV